MRRNADLSGMFFKRLMNCAVVFTLTLHNIDKCSTKFIENQRLSSDSVVKSSPVIGGSENKIKVKNVTFGDKSNILINSDNDKSQINREFPSSARRKRNSDNVYRDMNYDNDSEAGSSTQELPLCILSRSEFYLAWWVNEDGSLKLPPSNRNGSTMGFVDLSFKYQSETSMFEHITQLATDNPEDVITFMSMANNELKRLPIEVLKMVSVTLQYLSLANNNLINMFDLSEPFRKFGVKLVEYVNELSTF